jgi:hypothetical protein
MRSLSVLTLLLAGCATGGHQFLSGTKVEKASVSAEVVLYGIDSGAEEPPPSCQRLGDVRAWSLGEKTFPYSNFRTAAAELGGDSVIDIRPDPTSTNLRQPTHLGAVAKCR